MKTLLWVTLAAFVAVIGFVFLAPMLGRRAGEEVFAGKTPDQRPMDGFIGSPARPAQPAEPAAAAPATAPPTLGPLTVKQSDYGDRWPFTVPAGTVDCLPGQLAIFEVGSTRYAINGRARGAGNMRQFGLVDFHEIWRPLPGASGLKVNIGPMIDLALTRCER